MQREIDVLRRQVESSQTEGSEPQHSPVPATSARPESSNQTAPIEPTDQGPLGMGDSAPSHTSDSVNMAPTACQTCARTLDDFVLEPRKIDDCIDLSDALIFCSERKHG